MVTRLLSTRVKSIKMDVLTWYLRCFVGILIQGGEVQKDAKLGFSSQQHGGLVVLVMSVDNWYMIYVFPQRGVHDFIISVFQGMRHDFFQPHPRPSGDLCASQFGFAFDFACSLSIRTFYGQLSGD